MGYSWKNKFLFDEAKSILGGWEGRKLCSMGDQKLKAGGPGFKGIEEHILFDMNTSHRYPVVLTDLDYPLDVKWKNYFDITANCGMSEHVENQHQFFWNVDWTTKPGGLMLHFIPEHSYNHGWYGYNVEFFESLIDLNDYKKIILKAHTLPSGYTMVCVLLMKSDKKKEFKWDSIGIKERMKGVKPKGYYETKKKLLTEEERHGRQSKRNGS